MRHQQKFQVRFDKNERQNLLNVTSSKAKQKKSERANGNPESYTFDSLHTSRLLLYLLLLYSSGASRRRSKVTIHHFFVAIAIMSWLKIILQSDSFYYTYHYHENLNVSVCELSTKALNDWKPSCPPRMDRLKWIG
jgi:hypothetical protein